MAYSKVKLKSSGDIAALCFISFWIGKLSDRCLPIWTLVSIFSPVSDESKKSDQ
jgi:hypothetical protein